ncbi:conserved hypothetical protein [Histoplasma capsulatum var. duboisii H88]|uniref:Uncharacterized protein n=2 Tax=Ajellomyces capsulatus TaxID=5037 RepID=F0UEN9_AJEC8|nr:conserved hypothetical protein [Histoplasma capsulatum H143]EGC44769.1 conserved hypothetical protein [Histoplasma capsulatum var. duboisii H88]
MHLLLPTRTRGVSGVAGHRDAVVRKFLPRPVGQGPYSIPASLRPQVRRWLGYLLPVPARKGEEQMFDPKARYQRAALARRGLFKEALTPCFSKGGERGADG